MTGPLPFAKYQGAGNDFVVVDGRRPPGGGPAIQDMAGGQLDLMLDQAANALGPVRAGTVKPYAVMSKARWQTLPDVPSIDESGTPGLYVAYWHGMWAPKGTPKDVIAKLHQAYLKALADKDWQKRMSDQGIHLLPEAQYAPEALGKHTAAEVEKWRKVVTEAKIEIE